MSNALNTYNAEFYQGYFGKMPSNGDFVSKGLPQSFRNPWDLWLQGLMYTSKKELGDDWEQFYLTCPAYRFVLSPGVCGSQTWLGIMIPCVDQVGRYYPMTICRSLQENPNPLLALSDNEIWFSSAENLILSCLDDDFSLDTFDEKVQSLVLTKESDQDDDATSVRRVVQQHPKNAWRMTSAKPDLTELNPLLIKVLLDKFCLSFSVWWTKGSDVILPSTIITQGLPPVSGSSALLDGKWDQGGWESTHTLFRFSS